MGDGKLDPLDVGALERSVNDSATRVSGIWLSFVAFSAYLAAAASMITHRQIFLEEPIKLPTINIDLPLVASAILLPVLFVIYHVFVLLQVVLLARTADAYNQAIARAVPDPTDAMQVRQRLANTLFAQLFAGSTREREGVLGALLRAMAWITLAIAPVFVLIVFELKFLPYHGAGVTWTHRGLIVVDLLAILLLWAGAVDPRRDISWRDLVKSWKVSLAGGIIAAVCCLLFTFPGEPSRAWMRLLPASTETEDSVAACRLPALVEDLFVANFDRLFLPGESFVDGDKLTKIAASADAKDQPAYASERTRKFRDRDLSCGNFNGADLRRVDLTKARMSSARLDGAKLEGVRLTEANLERAALSGAALPGSDLAGANLQEAVLSGAQLQQSRLDKAMLKKAELGGAQLQNASLEDADLQGALLDGTVLEQASLKGANLRGAKLSSARAAGASLAGANLIGASLQGTQLQGASLYDANLIGAMLHGTQLQGADLEETRLQGADLYGMNARGAHFKRTRLQGALIRQARLTGASFSEAQLQGAQFDSPLRYVAISGSFLWLAQPQSCRDAWIVNPRLDGAIEVTYNRAQEVPVEATEEAVAAFIAKTIAAFPEGLNRDGRDGMVARLQRRLAPGARENADADGKKWETCAGATPQSTGDEDHEQAAVELAELACKEDPAKPYLARGLYLNWITAERLNASGAKVLAQRLIGSKESPCPGASGLDADTLKALHDLVDPKPAQD